MIKLSRLDLHSLLQVFGRLLKVELKKNTLNISKLFHLFQSQRLSVFMTMQKLPQIRTKQELSLSSLYQFSQELHQVEVNHVMR